MIKFETIDIKENEILKLSPLILEFLLKDKTTSKNIIWGTDNYQHLGVGYYSQDNMNLFLITGTYGEIIKPRIKKTKKEQHNRIKAKAEVFTPSWICNIQNNLIDEAWFGYKNVFNVEFDKCWKSNIGKIEFKSGKSWEDYIKIKRMEICCGEAPYLVSRYDTVTGDAIDIKERIGLLDRKLRVINENIDDQHEWFKWVKEAYRSIYGYEWQGDNLLLARENLFYTFRDNYIFKHKSVPKLEEELEILDIISWNIWQMDGTKFVVPNSCKSECYKQLSLFEEKQIKNECRGCKNNNIKNHNGIYCKIKNWDTGRIMKFINTIGKEGKI
jgi:hypothetical protein